MRSDWIRSYWNYIDKQEKERAAQQCPSCNGKGEYFEQGDCHRSPGIVPCGYRTKEGYCNRGVWEKYKS